jgi:nucleoside 2-deoxyribosyltransferase
LTPKVNAIGITTRNPFYESDGTTKRKEVELADKSEIQGMSTSDIAKGSQAPEKADLKKWMTMVRHNDKKIVIRDLGFIDSTDFTIAYMTDISAGTTCEIFYTGIIKKRPVFLLTNNVEVSMHPWISYACRYGKICKTEEELIRFLKRRYD